MDSEIGRLDYKTFRFKVIRKLISVGPNLWNTMCYFAEKATPPISLKLHDGYGPLSKTRKTGRQVGAMLFAVFAIGTGPTSYAMHQNSAPTTTSVRLLWWF